ncbi:ABC transporter substrate-binding protein [Dankookia sp. P2]|uniref:ABC transporter substrate-binding protein n=1 Tax=Dankookia sp. P2 TaxID=3423955 RepID=UPI003D677E7C
MAQAWIRAAALGGLLLAAGTAAAQTPAKVFRFATSTDAATLDPHATNALFTYLVVSQVYEPLTHRGDDLTLHPGLAVRWEQVEPTRWRFHLRDGVTFSGGESFEAEDAAFSIARVRAPTSNYGIYVDTVSGTEVVDRLHARRPHPHPGRHHPRQDEPRPGDGQRLVGGQPQRRAAEFRPAGGDLRRPQHERHRPLRHHPAGGRPAHRHGAQPALVGDRGQGGAGQRHRIPSTSC